MKQVRGNQKLYLTIGGIFLAVQLLSLIGLYLLDAPRPLLQPWSLVFVLFLLALFLTERYRLYYINVCLFAAAIIYLVVQFFGVFINAEWGYWKTINLLGYGALIVMLMFFIRYPIRIIKVSRQNKVGYGRGRT